SARAANVPTPCACVDDNEWAIAAAVNQGNAASTEAPSATTAHHHRGRPDPWANTHVKATAAASISPVGVRPARPIQNTRAHTSYHGATFDVRSRTIVVATHGRQPYPTTRLQCPCRSRSATYGFQAAMVTAT